MQTPVIAYPDPDGQNSHVHVSSALKSKSNPAEKEQSLAMDYGSLGRVVNDFLPLSGGEYEEPWMSEQYPSEATSEKYTNRPSANTLIYLCALCSSLTSVLLGYGAFYVESRRSEECVR